MHLLLSSALSGPQRYLYLLVVFFFKFSFIRTKTRFLVLEQEVRVDAVWAAGLLRQRVVLRLSARVNKQKKAKKNFRAARATF